MPGFCSNRHLIIVFFVVLAACAAVVYGAATQTGVVSNVRSSNNQPPPKMEFVAISKGEFTMGCSPSDGECSANEMPAHKVRITKGFELGKYEVTQAQWESIMGSNPSTFRGAERPVENVSWMEVQEFMAKMNARKDGYHYRLPTEAEWEYAARAGANDPDPVALPGYAWNRSNSDNATHPVGQLKPNNWGLYDMLGNVWEWVQDMYDPNYYQRSPEADPTGPVGLSEAVLRGGSWGYVGSSSRVSEREWCQRWEKSSNYGFRCARDADRRVSQ